MGRTPGLRRQTAGLGLVSSYVTHIDVLIAERAAVRMVMSRRWTVAVPHGCALRDGSGLSCPGGCSVALLRAVDRGAPDTE